MATLKEKKEQIKELISLARESQKQAILNNNEKRKKEDELEKEMIAPLQEAIEELEKTIEDMQEVINDKLSLYDQKEKEIERNRYEKLRDFVLQYFPIGSMVQQWTRHWSSNGNFFHYSDNNKGVIEMYDKDFSAPIKLGKYDSLPEDGEIIIRNIGRKKGYETILSINGSISYTNFMTYCLEGESNETANKLIKEKEKFLDEYNDAESKAEKEFEEDEED